MDILLGHEVREISTSNDLHVLAAQSFNRCPAYMVDYDDLNRKGLSRQCPLMYGVMRLLDGYAYIPFYCAAYNKSGQWDGCACPIQNDIEDLALRLSLAETSSAA